MVSSFSLTTYIARNVSTKPPSVGKRRSLPRSSFEESAGGLAVVQLSANEFLIVGDHVRVEIDATDKAPGAMMLRVEEGSFDNGRWITSRVWNGDQTDYGINLTDRPQVLKVTMARYR